MRLVVFFSRGMSLDGWQRAGILDRELALYRHLLPHLEQLTFLTYGGARDLELAAAMPGVEILSNRWRLPSNLYSVLAPFLHRRALAAATTFKTNQINGAWCAVIARRLYRKRLMVRCGFLWSDFVARLHGGWRRAAARRLERQACRSADVVVVAAEADRRVVVERYGIGAGRVHVIPNYVDTAMFRPMPDVARQSGHITFIGRLDEQKNVMALLEALHGAPGVTLTLVGEGPLRDRLETAALRLGVTATFLGTRPHHELPLLLNRSAAFVLPSHYEGNPKALVEAMACGVPVIGTRVPGIREILVHRETGYLCGTSAAEIRAAIEDVAADASLRERMSAGAIEYVRSHCSVQAAVAQELALLRSLDPGRATGPAPATANE
jgi:glycosyltransferase involved in cell wall biosynthesis